MGEQAEGRRKAEHSRMMEQGSRRPAQGRNGAAGGRQQGSRALGAMGEQAAGKGAEHRLQCGSRQPAMGSKETKHRVLQPAGSKRQEQGIGFKRGAGSG